MKRILLTIACSTALVFTIISCSSSRKTQLHTSRDLSLIVPDTFVLPDMPETLTTPEDRAHFLVMNYWSRFDFSNEALIERTHITEQAFVDYINILGFVSEDLAKESLIHTLRLSEENTKMYAYFVSLFEKYYYDLGSPFRNEALHAHVLQAALRSSILSESEKEPYRFQLEMAQKNNVGDRAADFHFTQENGETNTLHGLQSKYTLLVFSDPGCATCAAAIEQLRDCENLNVALARNVPSRTMLTVLTVYPNSDIAGWRASLSSKPTNWVHAFNPGMGIARQRLYDIRTFPTLYLLDSNKQVILKNASVAEVAAFFSAH